MHCSSARYRIGGVGKMESVMGRAVGVKAVAGWDEHVHQHWPGWRSQVAQMHIKTKKRVVEQRAG